MKILIAILVFGVIIAFHEFGHFIVAKLCGIRVNEFAIGMGPAIFKKQKGETLYALRLLPIGGFCAMEGEDSESADERAFRNKGFWKKTAVLVAGAFMNIVLGFIIVLIMLSTSEYLISTTVSAFDDNAVSSASGLQVDDEIKKINGVSIWTDRDVVYQLLNDTDGVVSMVVMRDGEKVNLDEVRFKTGKNEITGKQTIEIDFKVYRIRNSVGAVITGTFRETASVARLIWISLIDLLSGKYGFNELSGPVGIVGAIGEVTTYGWRSLMQMVVFITINVGVFNLLPLPALDGGRIVFCMISAITKKEIKPETEGMIHFIGLALLMLLMVAVTFNDIRKLFL